MPLPMPSTIFRNCIEIRYLCLVRKVTRAPRRRLCLSTREARATNPRPQEAFTPAGCTTPWGCASGHRHLRDGVATAVSAVSCCNGGLQLENSVPTRRVTTEGTHHTSASRQRRIPPPHPQNDKLVNQCTSRFGGRPRLGCARRRIVAPQPTAVSRPARRNLITDSHKSKRSA